MSGKCVMSTAADSSSVSMDEGSMSSETNRQSSQNHVNRVDAPDCPSSAASANVEIRIDDAQNAVEDHGSSRDSEDADARLTIDEGDPSRRKSSSSGDIGQSCESPSTLTASPVGADESPDSSTHPPGDENRQSCPNASSSSSLQEPGPSMSRSSSAASNKGILKRRLQQQPDLGDSDDSSSPCSSPALLGGENSGQGRSEGPPCKVPRTRRLNFKDVTVYYFPRTQGFTCVPSQGGATLGMSSSHSHVKTFSLTDHAKEQRRIHSRILRERRRMRAFQQRQLQMLKEREFQHRMKLLVEASKQQQQEMAAAAAAAAGPSGIGGGGGARMVAVVGGLQRSIDGPPHGDRTSPKTNQIDSHEQNPAAINHGLKTDGPSTSQPHQQIPGISASSNKDRDHEEGTLAPTDASQQGNDADSEETEPAEEDEEGAVVEDFVLGEGEPEESEEEEEEEDGEDEEDPWGEGSEDDVDDSYFFLQPVPSKRRRVLLKAAGIDDIDLQEKEDCKFIRSSREYCGCSCQGVCLPETCLCSKAGITCQVDRMNFPCGCNRLGCQNPAGRIEFNPARVRNHFLRTLMRLEMEETQAKYMETLQKNNSSQPAQKENTQSDQPHQIRHVAPTRVNTSCFMQSLARQVANNDEPGGSSSSNMEAGPSVAAAAAAMALNTLAFKAIMHHQQPPLDWSQFHQFPGTSLAAHNSDQSASRAEGSNENMVNFVVGDEGSDDDDEEEGSEEDKPKMDAQEAGSASNSSSPLGSSESVDSFSEQRTPLFGDFSVSTPGGIAGSLANHHSLDFASIFGDPHQLHHHLNQFHHEAHDGQLHGQHLVGFLNSGGEGTSYGTPESFFASMSQPHVLPQNSTDLVPINHDQEAQNSRNGNPVEVMEGIQNGDCLDNRSGETDEGAETNEGGQESRNEENSSSGENFGELIKKSIVETVSA